MKMSGKIEFESNDCSQILADFDPFFELQTAGTH